MNSDVLNNVMARPKDDHKVPRIAVQIPKPWHDFARKMASKRKQPMLWYILAVLAEDADKEGEDHPALPWEEDE